MRCPQCQHVNPPGARFCNACGAGLASVCPGCGHANAPGAASAAPAGRRSAPPTPRASDPLPFPGRLHAPPSRATHPRQPGGSRGRAQAGHGALRRHEGVHGAPGRPRSRGRAAVPRPRARAHDRRRPPLRGHGQPGSGRRDHGTVRSAPRPREPRRAGLLRGAPHAGGRRALRRRDAATLGVPIQIRIGLNSGEVVVGSIGSDLRMDYSALGQTTHLAARMEQMAKPASVLITADTLGLAEGYVQARPLGPVPVRGLADPVNVFELLGVTPARTRLQVAAVRGLTRLVGRDTELGLLAPGARAGPGGRGQVVALVGEAGVGKSRLAWEITRSHRTQDWLVLEGSAVSYGKTTTWLPVIDLLRAYFRVDRRGRRPHGPGEAHRTAPRARRGASADPRRLRGAAGGPRRGRGVEPLDPATSQQRTVEAVKGLLLRESQVQPLLLVLEDLHWIDGATQASSTAWSRACRPHAWSSWSTTALSTSTPGAARPTTAS